MIRLLLLLASISWAQTDNTQTQSQTRTVNNVELPGVSVSNVLKFNQLGTQVQQLYRSHAKTNGIKCINTTGNCIDFPDGSGLNSGLLLTTATVLGTANQITATVSGATVTLSLPSNLIAPGNITVSGKFISPLNNALAPGYTFSGINDTGFFADSSKNIYISANGISITTVSAGGSISTKGTVTTASNFLAPLNNALTPGYTFSGHTQTGLYADSGENIYLASNGVNISSFSPGGNLDMKSIQSTVYSAKSYGVLCDGSTDDTTAIQNMISAVPSSSTIIFPPQSKVCEISQILEINKPLTVDCNGATLQYKSGATIATSSPMFLIWPRNGSFEGVTIKNCTLDGNSQNTTQTGQQNSGILVETFINASTSTIGRIYLTNNKIQNVQGSGIQIGYSSPLSNLVNPPYDIWIENNIIQGWMNVMQGVALIYGDRIHLIHNTFQNYNGSSFAIDIEPDPVQYDTIANIDVIGNIISSSCPQGIADNGPGAAVATTTWNTTFIGNVIASTATIWAVTGSTAILRIGNMEPGGNNKIYDATYFVNSNSIIVTTISVSGSGFITANGNITSGSKFIGPLNNALAPSYTFNGINDTGFFADGSKNLYFSSNGIAITTITAGGAIQTNGTITSGSNFIAPLNNSLTPSYTFSGFTQTGLYADSSQNMYFASNAITVATISASGNISATYFTGSGANLTNITTGTISSGKFGDNRLAFSTAALVSGIWQPSVLPSTVAYSNKDNAWSATQTHNSSETFNGIVGIEMGTGAGYIKPAGLEYINTTSTQTNASTSEITLINTTIPANSFSSVGQGIRVKAWGFTNNNADSKTLKLYFQGNNELSASLQANSGSSFYLTFEAYWNSSTKIVYFWSLQHGSVTSDGDSNDGGVTLGNSTAIKLTGTNGVATNGDIVVDGMNIEYMSF